MTIKQYPNEHVIFFVEVEGSVILSSQDVFYTILFLVSSFNLIRRVYHAGISSTNVGRQVHGPKVKEEDVGQNSLQLNF